MQPPLKAGVVIDGELNNAAVHNKAWSVEVALPLTKYNFVITFIHFDITHHILL